MRIGVSIAWLSGPFVSGTVRQIDGRIVTVAVPSRSAARSGGDAVQPGCAARLRFHRAQDSSPVLRGVIGSGSSVPGLRLFDVEILDWDKLAGYWQSQQQRWPAARRRAAGGTV